MLTEPSTEFTYSQLVREQQRCSAECLESSAHASAVLENAVSASQAFVIALDLVLPGRACMWRGALRFLHLALEQANGGSAVALRR